MCPACGSAEVHFRQSRGDWICDACEHKWVESGEPAHAGAAARPRVFLSYGRRDAGALAEKIEQDLTFLGYEVWRDRRQIRAGADFLREIEDGLRSTQLVVALLSPHSVRRSADPNSRDDLDSVCLDEISYARFACKAPIVPVMAVPCEPPLAIFRLDYVDMQSWMHSEENYRAGLGRLRETIEGALRGEVRYRSWDDRLRPWDFASFLHEKRRDFCGREWLFAQIEDWRENRQERALLITGDPGVGKSAIVAELVHRNPGGQVLAYHCCQATTPETLRPDRFVRSLAAMIASKIPAYAEMLGTPAVEEDLAKDAVSAFEGAILTPLESLAAPVDGVRYLLVDALDEALAHPESLNIVTVLASRLNRLPGWLRLVATSRKEAGVLRRGELSGLRAWEISAEDPRNRDDIERFLAHRLGQPALHERLAQSGVTAAAAIGRIREACEGNFLWAQQALLGIERDQYRFDRLEELPPGLVGLYLDFFRRRFPDEAAFEGPRRVLQVVVAAAEPLGEAELAGATGLDVEDALPRALRELSAFLPAREGRYALYHKSIADWLTDPENRGTLHYASRKAGAERLADWCWAEYRRGVDRMSRYALRRLPAHLIEVERWDDLSAVLLDLPYLEARVEAGHVFELAVDFTRANAKMPSGHRAKRWLRLIEQALRGDLHFIARHPTTLFQCLWNRCWWYDCPQAEAHYEPPENGWPAEGPPWSRPAEERLSGLIEAWLEAKERRTPGFVWVRSLRPPPFPLGGAEVACFRNHKSKITCTTFSPDGRQIAVGCNDGLARIYDFDTGVELAAVGELDGGERRCIAYSPDGLRVLFGGARLEVWDLDGGTLTARFEGHTHVVMSAAFSTDGRYIASGSVDRTIRVWDVDTGVEHYCLRGGEGTVTCLAFLSYENRLISGSMDGTLRLWDISAGAEFACLPNHAGGVEAVACSPVDGKVASASEDGCIRIWSSSDGAELACLRTSRERIYGLDFSPDGQRIASGSSDGNIDVWLVESGSRLASYFEPADWLRSVEYSPDGRRIAAVTGKGLVRVWDAEASSSPLRLVAHSGVICSVACSPDGRRIASLGRDGVVRVWEAESGVELLRFSGDMECEESNTFKRSWGPFPLEFSPCGQIADAPDDASIRVWDYETGNGLFRLRGHEKPAWALAFSADGKSIASASEDGTVRVWDVGSASQVDCFVGVMSLTGHVLYSPDGRSLVQRSLAEVLRDWINRRGAIHVGEVASGEAPGDGPAVGDLRVSLTGREIALQREGSRDAMAWFPDEMTNLTACGRSRVFLGASNSHIYILKLEGF